ncbi:transaldolase [Candidatus Jorgensenbacteria bacterium RIFCSPLOWO2_12_FULL_42_11]|uniref:Transaldolase n=1 Tax=Candidatus Jorgensenbacteria bacterium RIFCSPLOWO2_12_FULL_42_11 TaxID=1798473 RepID=A0A1F6C3R5_9BACT|nr:MAG: transaldolase [Candidatus Jorgensenbacteria bacterium RIFCSPLOWO2_12_FULL_42_11]
MKPRNLKTKIFLDGGDSQETRKIIEILGFLDGQTTNPTLVSKNPEAQAKLARGEKFSSEEIYGFYREVIEKIAVLVPEGSVSIEVYADQSTKMDEMFSWGKEMFSWIPNAHIKFPITQEGLGAAEKAVKEGMRVNLTLCFSQEQAAAVYAATMGAKKGQVFISPFVGRLDDKGENGMDLIKNIIEMYGQGDGHVEVLTASVRNLDHFSYALRLGSDIVTAPSKILKEWVEKSMFLPDNNFVYDAGKFKPISYQAIGLNKKWREYDFYHELTDDGIRKFSEDWNRLIK